MNIAISMLLGSTYVYSMESNTETPIPLRQKISNVPQNPDAPRSLTVEAYLDSDLSYVSASIYGAGIYVDVYIENLDSEEETHYQIPGYGNSIMPISGSSGYWTITFVLSNGDVYYGEFYL